MKRAVIIEVGLNENQSKSDNCNVPYTPDEIAADAIECYEAGAAIVHFHNRDPESGALRATDADLAFETLDRIGQGTPLIAYPTYGNRVPVLDGYYVIGDPAPKRYPHFAEAARRGARLELAPLDLGSAIDVNAYRSLLVAEDGSRTETWSLARGHQINTGADHRWIIDLAGELGLKLTFAAFDTLHILNLRNLLDMGWTDDDPLILKLLLAGRHALEKRLLHLVDLIDEVLGDRRVEWMPVVIGADASPLTAPTVHLGGHLRTGIGDFHHGGDGEPTNRELVARCVERLRALGCEPASPDVARELLGLPPLTH